MRRWECDSNIAPDFHVEVVPLQIYCKLDQNVWVQLSCGDRLHFLPLTFPLQPLLLPLPFRLPYLLLKNCLAHHPLALQHP